MEVALISNIDHHSPSVLDQKYLGCQQQLGSVSPLLLTMSTPCLDIDWSVWDITWTSLTMFQKLSAKSCLKAAKKKKRWPLSTVSAELYKFAASTKKQTHLVHRPLIIWWPENINCNVASWVFAHCLISFLMMGHEFSIEYRSLPASHCLPEITINLLEKDVDLMAAYVFL